MHHSPILSAGLEQTIVIKVVHDGCIDTLQISNSNGSAAFGTFTTDDSVLLQARRRPQSFRRQEQVSHSVMIYFEVFNSVMIYFQHSFQDALTITLCASRTETFWKISPGTRTNSGATRPQMASMAMRPCWRGNGKGKRARSERS